MSDGADERHDLAVVEEEAHQGDGRLLLLPTHLPQDVSGGRRHGLDKEGGESQNRITRTGKGEKR